MTPFPYLSLYLQEMENSTKLRYNTTCTFKGFSLLQQVLKDHALHGACSNSNQTCLVSIGQQLQYYPHNCISSYISTCTYTRDSQLLSWSILLANSESQQTLSFQLSAILVSSVTFIIYFSYKSEMEPRVSLTLVKLVADSGYETVSRKQLSSNRN